MRPVGRACARATTRAAASGLAIARAKAISGCAARSVRRPGRRPERRTHTSLPSSTARLASMVCARRLSPLPTSCLLSRFASCATALSIRNWATISSTACTRSVHAIDWSADSSGWVLRLPFNLGLVLLRRSNHPIVPPYGNEADLASAPNAESLVNTYLKNRSFRRNDLHNSSQRDLTSELFL